MIRAHSIRAAGLTTAGLLLAVGWLGSPGGLPTRARAAGLGQAPSQKADVNPKAQAPAQPAAGNAALDLESGPVLDLEAGVKLAELILVAQVRDVNETTIVHGGRTAQVTQQFRLEPLRVLKGVFDRESLLMTGEDLGIYRFADESRRLSPGDTLLVMLGRNGLNWFNCNTAETLEQSIPRLSGADDPLVDATLVLVRAALESDRVAMVRMLVEGLAQANGRAALPLLRALARRPVPAAQTEGTLAAIRPLLTGPSALGKIEAARALEAILAADYLDQENLRREAVVALSSAMGDERAGSVELAGLAALAEAGPVVGGMAEVADWVRLDPQAATYAEVEARLRVIAGANAQGQLGEVTRFVESLPLDAADALQKQAIDTLRELDNEQAADQLGRRLRRKSELGLSLQGDLLQAGALPADRAAALLLTASSFVMNDRERMAFAEAARLAKDGRLVPALGTMLDPRNTQVRYAAIEALRAIDSPEAASTLAPHVAAEGDPTRRLQLYAFLGKHDLDSGQAFALEQLGMPAYAPWALEVLAAIKSPRTIDELRNVLATSQSVDWEASALWGLGRMGDREAVERLLAEARVGTGKRALASLQGLAELGSPDVLPLLEGALRSRDETWVVTAAGMTPATLRRLPDPVREQADVAERAKRLRETLAGLVEDRNASQSARDQALAALDALDDPLLAGSLRSAARDAALEGSALLTRVEAELAERRIALGDGTPRPE